MEELIYFRNYQNRSELNKNMGNKVIWYLTVTHTCLLVNADPLHSVNDRKNEDTCIKHEYFSNLTFAN